MITPAKKHALSALAPGISIGTAGGLGWQSPALTDRDRSIAVIAALVGQNVTDQRLLTYLSLARRNGVDQQGLTALMMLLTAYIGQPYTSLAMEAVHRSANPGQESTDD